MSKIIKSKGESPVKPIDKMAKPIDKMAKPIDKMAKPLTKPLAKTPPLVETKARLSTIFKSCLNILRDSEGLTGEKALRNMSYLLILKLIEPHIGNEIDMDTYPFDFSYMVDEIVEDHRTKLLKYVRFSNLSKASNDDIPNIMEFLWNDILSVHPATKNIFLKGKKFDIQHQATYGKLNNKINQIPITDVDILGNAYEEVIQDIMIGKVLGQFFTPTHVKKLMVSLVDPQIHADGTIDTCCDPTMGTGGFLITYLHHILEKAKVKDIKPNWDFIKTTGLYGKEIEPDTYQLAVSNMLISSGHMFGELERGDSIRQPINRKFDNVLANPPFGIKGLRYDEIKDELKFSYTPIRSDNAVSLFIQAIIYMLNLNGKCAIVIPDGQDLFSKSNKTLVHIREYLMKTCELKEVIYLPQDTFTHTSVKTCILFFIKKRECSSALKTKIITGKDQKFMRMEYKFATTHQTKKVNFYTWDFDKGVKTLLVEVSVKELAANSYALNYAEYIEEEEEEEYGDGIEVKTLGEVCKLNGSGKSNSKDITNTGEYPFYRASCENPSGTHKKYDFDGIQYILIVKSGGSSAKPISCDYGIGKVFLVEGKCAANVAVFQLLVNPTINVKYLYYYLLLIQPKIQSLAKYCTNNGNIDMNKLMELKIPIPPLEKQKDLVEYLDFLHDTNETSRKKIVDLKRLNNYCLYWQKVLPDNEVKELGEVCEIQNGKRIVKGQVKTGEYPVLGGGGVTSFYTDIYTREGKTCKISREGMSLHNCVMLLNEKYYLNSQAFTIISIDKRLSNNYLWYFIDNNKDRVFKCGRGSAQKAINIEEFKSIKIPIPPLEKQKKLVEYLDFNTKLIEQLEMEISNNKKQAEVVLNGILHQDVEDAEEEDAEDAEEEDVEDVEDVED